MQSHREDGESGSELEDEDEDPDSIQVPGGGRTLDSLASFKPSTPGPRPSFIQGASLQPGYTLTAPNSVDFVRPPQFPKLLYHGHNMGPAFPDVRPPGQGFSRVSMDSSTVGLGGGMNFFPVEAPTTDDNEDEGMGVAQTYAEYMPSKLKIGIKHPDPVVESTSLSSVAPMDVWYRVSFPQFTISTGQLSALQLESITYACQQHENILPDGTRSGFLIGDGAGVGKGRTIAGIIYENYLKGRKKAVWISVTNDLKYDSERDLSDIGAENIKVHCLSKLRYGKITGPENGKVKKGVLFCTYSALIAKSTSSEGGFRTRFDQIIDWCGSDFDGCLVFDECHRAKNLCPNSSGKPTQTGLTVLKLQARLPKARVVYASATGATEPRDMAYMTRLGIWGPGTPFREFSHFQVAMQKRGVGAMEILSMDMKLRGMYIARQLSFKGVSFKIVEVPLEEDFIKVYDLSTALWMEALRMFREASDMIQADRAMLTVMWSQFWSAHQRYFKYLCIAAKVKKAVSLAREAVKCGKCVVIGLQSTGEARTLDQLDKDDGELNSFVSTAKGVFRTMVEKHFPAPDRKKISEFFNIYNHSSTTELLSGKRKAEEDTNSNSKKYRIMHYSDNSGESSDDFSDDEIVLKTTPAEKPKKEVEKNDKHYNSYLNKSSYSSADFVHKAWKIKEELLSKIDELGDRLPPNAIDDIIDELGGADNVAELTGRKGRIVHNDEGFIYESRSGQETPREMINIMEKQKFMDGDKDVAIISEAASSGISLHSDRRALNKRCRVHITLELPWSADRAIQQFGRTHRSNQVNAPEYIFLISNLAGERRFASIVAKRLESLGALTHGDRRATESRDLSRFNIDNNYGRAAMEVSLRTILGLERPLVSPPKSYKGEKFFEDVKAALVGVGMVTPSEGDPDLLVLDGERRSIGRFLNRILGMPVNLQNSLFDYFTDTMEAIIEQAKRAGRYDLGILDLAGNGGNIRRVAVYKYTRKHVGKPVTTELHKFCVERGMSWVEALQVWARRRDTADGFYLSNQLKNGHREVMLVMALEEEIEDSKKQSLFTLYKPNIGEQVKRESMKTIGKRFRRVELEDAEEAWHDHYLASMSTCSHAYWTGACRTSLLGQVCDVGLRERTYNVLSGSVLCVWSLVEMVLAERCGMNAKLQMVRLKTKDGTKLVGSLIPNLCIAPLHEALSKDAENVNVEIIDPSHLGSQ